MKMEFKQAVHLDGKDYHKGMHDVPEEVLKGKLAHSMILRGLIVEAKEVITPVSIMDQQKKLADRLMASKSPATKKAADPVMAEEPAWEPQVEEQPESKPEQKAKHKTRKR